MKRRTVLLSTAALPLGLAANASSAATTNAPKSFNVQAVQLPAWINEAGAKKPLQPGTVLTTSQEVETASGGALVLQLPEGSIIRLGEKTRLGVLAWRSSEDKGQVALESQLKLYGGVFRFATSAISKITGKRRIELALRTATVGIRGTDFWSMTDEVHDAACIFEGRIDLATKEQGELVLDKPTAFWARFFDKPLQPIGNATPQQLTTFLDSTELKPGTGILVNGGRWNLTLDTLNARDARQLAIDLQKEGYPAVAVSNKAVVRIDQLATQQDADAVLAKISALPGFKGRISR